MVWMKGRREWGSFIHRVSKPLLLMCRMTYEEPTEQMTFQAMPNKDTPNNARGHFSGAGGYVGL